MYKVLIVDDEQPVVESISFMLQKYRPEIGIAGTAMSGREAINAAEETNPDIILIDVKMPGIDGLEALREIKRRSPNILPILTTAYERFDIAQTAFELGVQDYILKPFSRDKLIAAVDAAVESLDQRLDGRGDSLKHIELYHALSSSVEKLLFRAIKLNLDVKDFLPYLKATLSFRTTRACIGILELEHGDESSMSKFSQEAISTIKYKYACLAASFTGEVLFFFPELTEGRSIPDESAIESLLAQKSLDEMQWRYAFGECVDFEQISTSYFNARRAVMHQVSTLDGKTLLSYSKKWRKELAAAFQNGDIEGVKQLIVEVLEKTSDADTAERVLRELFLYIEHSSSVTSGIHLQAAGYLAYNHIQRSEELLNFYYQWGRKLTEQLNTDSLENIPRVLSRALDYLNLNYSRPLQLSDVADRVEVSSAYLSNLFTRHLRRSFIDQLTQIRMEKAKQLLKDHTYSIKEISSMVGYQDPNYFSRLFKRCTGSSPSEFD